MHIQAYIWDGQGCVFKVNALGCLCWLWSLTRAWRAAQNYRDLATCLVQNRPAVHRSQSCFYGERNAPRVLWVSEGTAEDVVEPLVVHGSSLDSAKPRVLRVALYCWIIQESFTNDCKSRRMGGPRGSSAANVQYSRRKLSIRQVFVGLWARKE